MYKARRVIIMAALAALSTILLVSASQALLESEFNPVEVRTTWEPPTMREDGTPLAANEIGGYELLWIRPDGTQLAVRVERPEEGAELPTSSVYWPDGGPGVYQVSIRAWDTDDVFSTASETVSRVVDEPTSHVLAPIHFNVTVMVEVICPSGNCTIVGTQ